MAFTSTSSHFHHPSGMGQVLLVFLPQPSSSAPSSATSHKPFRRTSFHTVPIVSKAQSTVTICALLVFFSLLLFALSTFEPSVSAPTRSRRFLAQNPSGSDRGNVSSWVEGLWKNTFALQGMGRLFLRGNAASSDLVVAHVAEDTNEADFRIFLRLLHRSGVTSRADTVFLFHSLAALSAFEALIQEQNLSFLKLRREFTRTSRHSVSSRGFDVTRFSKSGKKEMGQPLWGKRIRVSDSTEPEPSVGELARLSYGSVVGFEVSELDPENSLAGFLDHVSMNMRRWACYPMLLGRLRRNFKHIMLVDAKNLVLLSDPLGRVRTQSAESVYLFVKQETASGKHKKNSEKTQLHPQVDSAVVMGGARGIRRFSSAMLTEIVRVAMQHKKKSSVSTESGILNQLVGNGHILKHVNLIRSTEWIPDPSSLSGLYWENESKYSIIQRGNANNLNSIIMKKICSGELDYSVYRDCSSTKI